MLTENLKKNKLIVAVQKTLEKLHGSYALAILFKNNQDLIVGARRGSPLAVGYGTNENFLGSDSYALKSMTNKISYLDDGDICIVKKDKVDFYNSKGKKKNDLSCNETPKSPKSPKSCPIDHSLGISMFFFLKFCNCNK